MIKYRLQCDHEHTFDAWFANSAAFDTQAAHGLIACVECGSAKVAKAIMAPNVGIKGNRKAAGGASKKPAALPAPEVPSNPVVAANTAALSGEDAKRSAVARELAALLRKVRAEVAAKAEYVGPDFAEEARKIHYDEAPNRGIYGEATPDDVAALVDEGIAVMPLPALPEDGH
jgi:hypothetical protein